MSPHKLVRVVFDTNALISAAIIPGSVSRRALLHAVQNFQLVHSDGTWAELYEVIHRCKFDWYLPGNGRNDFLLAIARASEFVDVSISISDCPRSEGQQIPGAGRRSRGADYRERRWSPQEHDSIQGHRHHHASAI